MQGEAEGDLYIDEYDNHNYQSGQYIKRHFTFFHNKLKKHVSVSLPSQSLGDWR